MHLSDPELRARLPEFQLRAGAIGDGCVQRLLALFREKGFRAVLFALPTLYGLPCVMCQVYDDNQGVQCHGGIAVRSHVVAAARSALREAYMQYITYFAGTRDDYRPFAPMKQARIGYRNAEALYFGQAGSEPVERPPADYASVGEELDGVVRALTESDIRHILVADLSPHDAYKLSSVKVIVPRMDLWFCPVFKPSPVFPERAARLRKEQGML